MTVYAKTGTSSATARASVSIAVKTQLLLHWSDIAIEQERLAWEARELAESTRDEAMSTGKALPIELELRASMIAIAATSHALDALYGELRDLALPPMLAEKRRTDRRSGGTRPRKLQETLNHGFEIPAQRWMSELVELFALRDAAVHPETLFHEPQPHPLGVNTALEYTLYRCEEARKALDLLFEILETCVERPKPALEEWAKTLRSSLEQRKTDRGPRHQSA